MRTAPFWKNSKSLDPSSGELASQRKLFETLYRDAGDGGYATEDVDRLLARQIARNGGDSVPEGSVDEETRESMLQMLENQERRSLANLVGKGDPRLLYQQILEQSGGPLRSFLEQGEPDWTEVTDCAQVLEGILEAAGEHGFSADDLRTALIGALGTPLEVERMLDRLLEENPEPQGNDALLLDIVRGMDLKSRGIYSPEQLLDALYEALRSAGLSKKEALEVLRSHFPDHADLKEGLAGSSGGFLVPGLIGLLGLGLLLLLIFLRRRRK
ncbi:MAG: hypothetical protein R2751_13070 [Bacteroidales bacterium]